MDPNSQANVEWWTFSKLMVPLLLSHSWAIWLKRGIKYRRPSIYLVSSRIVNTGYLSPSSGARTSTAPYQTMFAGLGRHWDSWITACLRHLLRSGDEIGWLKRPFRLMLVLCCRLSFSSYEICLVRPFFLVLTASIMNFQRSIFKPLSDKAE